MVQKDAKLILQRADTFVDRVKAVETAVSMGMPLSEIEECLDWLERVYSCFYFAIRGTPLFLCPPAHDPSRAISAGRVLGSTRRGIT